MKKGWFLAEVSMFEIIKQLKNEEEDIFEDFAMFVLGLNTNISAYTTMA